MAGTRRGGGVSKRCECRGESGKLLGTACPLLPKKTHGRFTVRQELPPDVEGKRRTFRRTGYVSNKDALADLDRIRAILDLAGDDGDAQRRVGDLLQGLMKERRPIPEGAEVSRKLGVGVPLDGKMTVGDWLDQWLTSKKTRRNTTRGYASHVRVHLNPRLGHHRLDRLNVGHVIEMFDAIADENEVIEAENAARREQVARCKPGRAGAPKAEERPKYAEERAKLDAMKPFRRTTSAATRQRIRATLRTALNAAIGRQLITFNPAGQHLEISSGKRPKAQLWTDDRVEEWRRTGKKPSPVMVWTPEQIGAFLDAAYDDRLYAFFHLVAFRGLRRGEGVGQEWTDVDLDTGRLTVAKEIVQDGWESYESDPKTDSGARTIALGAETVKVLKAHRRRQAAERLKWGEAWTDTGKVFTTEKGGWLHPQSLSDRFERISRAAGLPPINLRDLRHCAATLVHAGGGDMHTIKETLGHSTITLTSDTYTSLLPELDREIADRAAALVPRARRGNDRVVDG